MEKLIDKDNFISVLFYLGLLIRDRIVRGKEYLKIPNLSIKKFYSQYLRAAYDEVDIFRLDVEVFKSLILDMAYDGKWEKAFDYLANQIDQQTKIRDYLNGEKVIQGFLLAYMNIADVFTIHNEYEASKGFADFYLEPFFAKYSDARYSYLIELKYVKREANEQEIEERIKEAKTQLFKYEQDEVVQRTKGNTELKKLILIFKGWELVVRQES